MWADVRVKVEKSRRNYVISCKNEDKKGQ